MESLIIKVVTLGCKLNQCESASIVSALKNSGYNASEGLELADVYILNTCSVTAEADRKSRQYIAKMRKLNPECKIIIVGCSAQNHPSDFVKSNVIAVGGASNKCDFVLNSIKFVQNHIHYSTLSDRVLYQNEPISGCCLDDVPYPVYDRTRAYVKIQDGCDRFCSYCIIPYLRGRSRSRSIASIAEECEQVRSREIILVGVDISVYGKDIGTSLDELLISLKHIPARKRLGSLECEAVTPDLLNAMKNGEFCPHFHLSLQNGNNDVLRTMNRRYDKTFYMQKVSLIREYFPLAGITTDVIVGFPTETDECFADSCEFIKACEFSDIHVFPYSARKGTIAYNKYDALPGRVVDERVETLLDIKRSAREAFLKKNIGTVAQVYAETMHGELSVGYTPNYIRVYSDTAVGTLENLKLNELYLDGLRGSAAAED